MSLLGPNAAGRLSRDARSGKLPSADAGAHRVEEQVSSRSALGKRDEPRTSSGDGGAQFSRLP